MEELKNILFFVFMFLSIITSAYGLIGVLHNNFHMQKINGMRKFIPPEEWLKYYMGDDGTTSMYIDAVKGEYAISSTSPNRTKWDMDVKQYFQEMQNVNR